MQIQIIISNVLLGIGLFGIAMGTLGIFKFKNFYSRLLTSSMIDTIGTVTIIIGLMVRSGFTFFTAKLLLLLIVFMIVSPLAAHMLVRSAVLSKHSMKELVSAEDDFD